MNEPLITDWINSFAALLGVPLVVWGIVQLFLKNKSQDRKLTSLENLAKSQNDVVLKMSEQIQELSMQTSEFQFQSELMKESNLLIQKQIELQNDMYLHSKISEEKKYELQRIERISKIKPHFVFSGSNSSPSGFTVKLLNKGQTARKLSLQQIDNEFAKFSPIDENKEYDNNQKIEISGYADSSKTFYNSNQVPFSIELFFEDIDGNKYKQRVTKDGNYRITAPEQIEK